MFERAGKQSRTARGREFLGEGASPVPGKCTLTESLQPATTSAPVQRSSSHSAGTSTIETTAAPNIEFGGSKTAGRAAAPSCAAAGSSQPTLQMLFGVRRSAVPASAENPTDVQAAAARGMSTPTSKLPYADQIQRAFGRHDVSGIKAHTGADAAAAARVIGALAYATGDHVVLGDSVDLHTVAHEAAHVIQQRGGVQLKGGVGEVGDAYERQADEVADCVVRGESAEGHFSALAGESTCGRPQVQKKISFDGGETVEQSIPPEIIRRARQAGVLPLLQRRYIGEKVHTAHADWDAVLASVIAEGESHERPSQAPTRLRRGSKAARRKQRQRQGAIDYRDKQQQRQRDDAVGRDQRELEGIPTFLGDFLEVVFDDNPQPLRDLIDKLGMAGVQELHRAFSGPAGLPVLATLLDELFLGAVEPLAILVRALGSGEVLRELYAAFDGDMARLAMQLTRFGIKEFAAVYLAKQREHKAAEAERSDPQEDIPNGALRVERLTRRDVRAAAESHAAFIETDESVKHPEAHPVLLEWLQLEAELDTFDRTVTGDPDAVGEWIDKADELVKRTDDAIEAIETAWFAWLRYAHSLGKLREIRAAALARRDTLFERFKKAPRKMSFADQRMVPSAADLPAIVDKQRELRRLGVRTRSQAWALVGADKKGESHQAHYRVMALERLKTLNHAWDTHYGEDDLDTILRHIRNLPVMTNYFFKALPGANVSPNSTLQEPLIDLLMKSEHFKNVWETGASQASANLANRGAIEEQMGYSAALHRRTGKLHEMDRQDTPFEITGGSDKRVIDAAEMPKYAGLVSPSQKHGVATRYGSSYVVWKPTVRARMTHTPGDSWSKAEQGVAHLTSNAYPEVLLVHANASLIRLACAEATGRDQKWLADMRKSDTDFNSSYIETQIHGDLTWRDVSEIVIGFGRQVHVTPTTDIEIENVSPKEAVELAKQLQQFAHDNHYDFKVRVKDTSGG